MNTRRFATLLTFLGCLGFSTLSTGAQADEICRPCPFDCGGIGASSGHCSSRGMRNGQCCVDLDHRGQNTLSQTDQINSGRAQYGGNPGWGYGGNDCPPGFSPRSQKCGDDERRRGCNDLHGPSGQTCVGWNQRPRR